MTLAPAAIVQSRNPQLPQYALDPVGGRAVFLGDSITVASDDMANGVWDLRGWPAQLVSRSDGSLIAVHNAGVAGNTTTQMLARLHSDVIARRPNLCFVMGGANDVATGTPVATTIANLDAILSRLIANGITPLLSLVTPRGPGSTADLIAGVFILNRAIRELAMRRRIVLLDPVTALLDTTGTGTMAAALAADTVHPNSAGMVAIANAFATQLASTIPSLPAVPLAYGSPQTDNLVGDGCFTTGSATLPTGWTGSGTTRTTDPAYFGSRLEIASTGSLVVATSASFNVTAGHTYLLAFRYAWAPSDATVTAGFRITGLFGQLRLLGGAGAAAVAAGVFAAQRTANATGASQVQLSANTGTGSFTIGQVAVYDLGVL